MVNSQETMRQVFDDRVELVAWILKGDTAFRISWTTKEATLALCFPVDF